VGPADSVYTLKLYTPKSLSICVSPEKLVFSKVGQKIQYSMTVSSNANDGKKFMEGSLSWVSRNHVVRSPIVAAADLDSPPL
jgi:hypothetical protein